MAKLSKKTRKEFLLFNAKEKREFLRELEIERKARIKAQLKEDGNTQRRESFRELMTKTINALNEMPAYKESPMKVVISVFGAEQTKGMRCDIVRGKEGSILSITFNARKFVASKVRQLVAGVHGRLLQVLNGIDPHAPKVDLVDPPKTNSKPKSKPKARAKAAETTAKPKVKAKAKPKAKAKA